MYCSSRSAYGTLCIYSVLSDLTRSLKEVILIPDNLAAVVVVERPDHVAHVAYVVDGLLQHPNLAHPLTPLEMMI